MAAVVLVCVGHVCALSWLCSSWGKVVALDDAAQWGILAELVWFIQVITLNKKQWIELTYTGRKMLCIIVTTMSNNILFLAPPKI